VDTLFIGSHGKKCRQVHLKKEISEPQRRRDTEKSQRNEKKATDYTDYTDKNRKLTTDGHR